MLQLQADVLSCGPVLRVYLPGALHQPSRQSVKIDRTCSAWHASRCDGRVPGCSGFQSKTLKHADDDLLWAVLLAIRGGTVVK